MYGSQQLSITKRAVNLKSDSASKVFDGTALTRPEVAGWKQLGDEGFVDGQVSAVRATGSATHVSDGKVANAIAYTEGEGFNTDNYAISKDEGALSVTAKQIAAADMTVQAPADVVYSGKAQQQKPVVKDGDKVLVEGVDYELTYSGNATDAGTVTVTVTGKGDYAGSVDVAYRINARAADGGHRKRQQGLRRQAPDRRRQGRWPGERRDRRVQAGRQPDQGRLER